MIEDKSGWIWMNDDEYGWIWRNMDDSGGIWMIEDESWKNMEGSGGIWKDLEGSGRIWKDLEGYGRIWKGLYDTSRSFSRIFYIPQDLLSPQDIQKLSRGCHPIAPNHVLPSKEHVVKSGCRHHDGEALDILYTGFCMSVWLGVKRPWYLVLDFIV